MKRFLKILFAILLFPFFLTISFIVGLIDLYMIYDDTFDNENDID